MKKILALLLLLLLLLCVPSALADTNRVIDEADVLTASEESALEEAITFIREAYSFDVVVLTKTSISGRTAHYYAADYFEAQGYGYGDKKDGIIVLLVTGAAAGDRDMGIASHGRGEKVFDINEIYAIEDAILPALRASNYGKGMTQFVELVGDRLNDFTSTNRTKRVAPFILLGGLVIGLIVAFVLKGQMKSARRKSDASSYVREGSFNLSRVQDIYLYTTTTRRRIETQSSGGGSRGGGGFTTSSGGHATGHSTKF